MWHRFFSLAPRGCEEITGRRHHDFLVWLKILLGWSDIGKDSCESGPTDDRSEVRGSSATSSLTPILIFMHLPGMPADGGVGRVDGSDGAASTAGARPPPKKKAKYLTTRSRGQGTERPSKARSSSIRRTTQSLRWRCACDGTRPRVIPSAPTLAPTANGARRMTMVTNVPVACPLCPARPSSKFAVCSYQLELHWQEKHQQGFDIDMPAELQAKAKLSVHEREWAAVAGAERGKATPKCKIAGCECGGK